MCLHCPRAISLNVGQSEWSCRLIHISKKLGEKSLVLFPADAISRVYHKISEGHWSRQAIGLPQKVSFHLLIQEVDRSEVTDEVMDQLKNQPSTVQRIFGNEQSPQRRMVHVEAVTSGIELARSCSETSPAA